MRDKYLMENIKTNPALFVFITIKTEEKKYYKLNSRKIAQTQHTSYFLT